MLSPKLTQIGPRNNKSKSILNLKGIGKVNMHGSRTGLRREERGGVIDHSSITDIFSEGASERAQRTTLSQLGNFLEVSE